MTEPRINTEIRNRIRWSVASASYELFNETLMTDGEYDALALSINTEVSTGNEACDKFFRETFSPDTGANIRSHPELSKLKDLTEMLIKDILK